MNQSISVQAAGVCGLPASSLHRMDRVEERPKRIGRCRYESGGRCGAVLSTSLAGAGGDETRLLVVQPDAHMKPPSHRYPPVGPLTGGSLERTNFPAATLAIR
jgi:hypothetical protein